jgi:hypothetical protein
MGAKNSFILNFSRSINSHQLLRNTSISFKVSTEICRLNERSLHIPSRRGPGTTRRTPSPSVLFSSLEANQVAIKITATAVNPVDWKIRDYNVFLKQVRGR